MLMRVFPLQFVLAAAVSTTLVVGCGRNGEEQPAPVEGEAPQAAGEVHDPHDVPLTEEEIAQLKEETAQYEDAVEHIRQSQQTIEQETTDGEAAHAHRALDKLDIVLERLPEAAQRSGVPKERWQEVNETAQKLRELMDQIHANIDAGEDPNYQAFADEIEQAVETLAAVEPEPAE